MKSSLKLSVILGAACTALIPGTAKAADSIMLTNGNLHHHFEIEEFNTLAQGNRSASCLGDMLSRAGIAPEAARAFLTQGVSYDVASADVLFRNNEGRALLQEIGAVIQPVERQTNAEQSLRAAVVTSLMDDGQMTPLEILANYPVKAQVNLKELRSRNLLNTSFSSMESMQVQSKAQIAQAELATRFAQSDERMQSRYYAMWFNRSTTTASRPVALEARQVQVQRPQVQQTQVAPVRGLW